MLYALQGTGNGHVARARAIIPILQKYCDLDVWLGGTESEVDLPVQPNFLKRGLVMIYNKQGSVSYSRTLFGNNYISILKDLIKAPVKQYDLVINDFEFLTSWACYFRGVKCIQLSHQASFHFSETPRPKQKSRLGELVLRYYARGDEYIGFHFNSYHPNIHRPVIRPEIRSLLPVNNRHVTVYLPAFHHDFLLHELLPFYKTKWHVFSKFANSKFTHNNVTIFPVNNKTFIQSFVSCAGVFCGAGFETPAEAMYLGKKVIVMPIAKQYEQYCNATALKMEGVSVVQSFQKEDQLIIKRWLEQPQPTRKAMPDDIEKLLVSIVSDTRKPAI